MNTIADIRKEYKLQSLSEKDALPDPFAQFSKWWNEATNAGIDEINAMTLASAPPMSKPDARIVLLKGFDDKKALPSLRIIRAPKRGNSCWRIRVPAWCFPGKSWKRQIRISGLSRRRSATRENDKYFNSRPEGSRIGAWASPQSEGDRRP